MLTTVSQLSATCQGTDLLTSLSPKFIESTLFRQYCLFLVYDTYQFTSCGDLIVLLDIMSSSSLLSAVVLNVKKTSYSNYFMIYSVCGFPAYFDFFMLVCHISMILKTFFTDRRMKCHKAKTKKKI